MQFTNRQHRRSGQSGARLAEGPWRPHWCRAMAWLVAMAALTGAAQNSQPLNPDKSIHDPVLTAPPDANAQMEMREKQARQQDYTAANAERKNRSPTTAQSCSNWLPT